MPLAIPSLAYLTSDILDGRITYSCTAAAGCLLIYDYILTLPAEIELFWRWESSGAAALFFATRYVVVPVVGMVTVCTLWQNPKALYADSCLPSAIIYQVFAVLQFLPYSAFSALRVRGFVGSSRTKTSYWDAELACQLHQMWFYLVRNFILLSRLSVIVADTIVISFIAASAYKGRDVYRMMPEGTPSFIRLLFRDGSIYFGVTFLLNCLHVTMTALHASFVTTNDMGASNVTIFTDPLTAILVWRALINLRRLNKRVTDPTFSSDLLSQFGAGAEDASHLSFRRSLGLATLSRLSSHDDTVE
ncbi:hypothetical protein K466DRAFT_664212 [Polyporus arcularius HHB13444]|uniref:DUF6533 domain-containing protein n=1 Tax=Polyporus arcularius HHB13444 TaxID=1314778 RepID=A0A5C3PA58_9APHY|nr:hypothetical protein K466DRAFT_664212 [Polyporus arcularius HHB13444]